MSVHNFAAYSISNVVKNCLRSFISERNEVRFEKQDKELLRSEKALMQITNGGRFVRTGVLSPRPDVIGPRDLARLTAATLARRPDGRRSYDSELDMAAVEEQAQKEYYDNPGRLVDADKPSQLGSALRRNLYVRRRNQRQKAAQFTTPTVPTTLSIIRSLTPRTLPPDLPVYSPQNIPNLQSTVLFDFVLPVLDGAQPSEVDLPPFGDDVGGLAVEAHAVDPANNNFPETTAGTNIPVFKFRADGISGANLANAPKKQRFDNFVKFIQANKDLVAEYVKKKRLSYKTSTRVDRVQAESAVVPNWSLDPLEQGVPSPTMTEHPPTSEASLRPWASNGASSSTMQRTDNTLVLRQGDANDPATIHEPQQLDLAFARGGAIAAMRVKVKSAACFFTYLCRYAFSPLLRVGMHKSPFIRYSFQNI